MTNPSHHLANTTLTIIGSTTAVGALIPGDSFRVWSLFCLSALCSFCYLAINGKHLIVSIKSWFQKGTDDDLPPED